jgi:hypothetical protein
MASNHPSFIDARRSNFHSVGRDQNTFHIDNVVTIINLASEHARRTTKKRPRHDDTDNISKPPHDDIDTDKIFGIQHKRRNLSLQASCCSPGGGSAGDVADSLIIKVVQLLIDRGETGEYYRRLELELETLHHTLTLTTLAIQTYERTPLGRNLEHSIDPEVEQICVVLQELFDRIDGYRQGLWPTSIRNLWRKVWWRGCEMDDALALMKTKLAASQQLLSQFLVALNL